jgi:FixJ family two-component response regulator
LRWIKDCTRDHAHKAKQTALDRFTWREDMEPSRRLQVQEDAIVIVDDDDAVRNSLKFSLEMEGYAVLAFADGLQLLGRPELSLCGCLVIDQNLPTLSGLDLIAALRKRQFLAPAILITSHPSDALRRQAALAGITIVEKPLLNGRLFDVIRLAMTEPSQRRH